MLAQTVRSNLRDINNLRMRTKTAKFSSMFQSEPTVGVEESEIRQVLMKDGLVDITEDDDISFDDILVAEEEPKMVEIEVVDEEDDDDAYNFVEDPNEVVVQFPILSNIQLDEPLPFFKSLSLKLANI